MVIYENLTIPLADVNINSGYLVVVTKEGSESENGIFRMSMARDMRHPYIPSTTVLGDNLVCMSKRNDPCVIE